MIYRIRFDQFSNLYIVQVRVFVFWFKVETFSSYNLAMVHIRKHLKG